MSYSTDRATRVVRAAHEVGAQGAYLRDTANIAWVTGFEGVFDDEQAHALFVAPEVAFRIHTDSRYVTALERAAEGTPFLVDASQQAMSAWAAEQWRALIGEGTKGAVDEAADGTPYGENIDDNARGARQGAPRLAIEDTLSLHEYRALERAFANVACGNTAVAVSETVSDRVDVTQLPFIETHDLVLALRAVKDAQELELMRAAQAVTDAAFDHILGFITPGMTEREVQLELDGFMLRNGADELAFPSIVASGANGASPHALVSDKRIAPGECIVMDFGARRGGYCSDMTRTVFVGRPDDTCAHAWDVLRRANETVEETLCVGMTGRQAHECALAVLDAGGFAGRMGHGLGHGVGIQIHELPTLSPRNTAPLVAGNVVTVEPGIYIPGAFGMRLEDCGVITDAGFERFTRSTHEMVVI